MEFKDNDRIQRIRDGATGTVTGHWNHLHSPSMLYMIRFDDPGLDDDFEEETAIEPVYPYTADQAEGMARCLECEHTEYEHRAKDGQGCVGIADYETETNSLVRCYCHEFVEDATLGKQANEVYVFPNGNIIVMDNYGQQIPELQGSWIHIGYVRRLARIIVRDNVRVIGRLPHNYLGDMVQAITKGGRSVSRYTRGRSAHSVQYGVPQPSSHSQCRYQHGRIAVALLAQMGNTLKSNPLANFEREKEQLFQLLLALYWCEEGECRVVRTLAEQALNNLRLVLESFLPTHTEHSLPPQP